jgi:pre-mRNA-splicing helicase BRR2
MQVLSAAGQHQVLIFVHSRKETAKTARYLKETALANDTLMRFMKASPAARMLAGMIHQGLPGSPLHAWLPALVVFPHAQWRTSCLIFMPCRLAPVIAPAIALL